jgi:RNA polymerase sigma factor (sigma-70 family)
MATAHLASTVRYVLKLASSSQLRDWTDLQLLKQFSSDRDEQAFAELMSRHAALVLSVCRRVLQHEQDAEDAFQATFLVLAQRAGSIRKGTALASWLYGVAYRISSKQKISLARLHRREQRTTLCAPNDPAYQAAWNDLQRVLDDELQLLPERYRLPFVLCCLQGKSKSETAAEVGWKEGTVASRLAQARKLLQQRLTRRGVTLSAGLAALAVSGSWATAQVPFRLAASSVLAARHFVESSPAVGELVSAQALALAENFGRGTAMTALSWCPALLLLASLIATTSSLLSQATEAIPASPDPVRSTVEAAATSAPQLQASATDHHGDPLPEGALARLGTERWRPGGYPHDLACLPDGKSLFALDEEQNTVGPQVVSENTLVTLWDLGTGKLQRRFRGPTHPPFGALGAPSMLSPDGRLWAVLGFSDQRGKKDLTFWDVATGKELPSLAVKGIDAWALAWSPNSTLLVLASNRKGDLRLWDVARRSEVRHFQELPQWWLHLAFSPDGRILATANRDGEALQLWDVATGRPLQALGSLAQKQRSLLLAFSPDGKLLATAAPGDKSIHLWDTATGQERNGCVGEVGTASLAFSPDGKTLASGDARKDGPSLKHSLVRLWDVATRKEIRRVPGHLFGVDVLTFSRDGRKLISGGAGSALRVYEVATGKELFPAEAHESFVNSLSFAPDGKTVATGGVDGEIRLWDAASGKPLRLFAGPPYRVSQVLFSPDGRSLVSVGEDGTARIWDPATGQQTGQLPTRSRMMESLASSPDGRTLVWCDDRYVLHFWDTATRRELDRPMIPKGRPGSFSPDGKLLAIINSGSPDPQGDVALVDTVTGKEIRTWKVPQLTVGPVISPDRQIIAAAEQDRKLHFLNIATGKDQAFVLEAQPVCLDFSRDSRLLAIGTAEGSILLWEVAAGQVRRRLQGHLSSVNSISLSPDGTRLASGSNDSTALVWDLTGGEELKRLLPNPVSREELPRLWSALAGDDAGKAYQAQLALRSSPGQVLPFLKEKLKPEAALDSQRLAQLIADLDSPRFVVRQEAMQDLQALGERAGSALTRALQGQPTLEMRQRLERLLSQLKTPVAAPELLRSLRAVEALEQIGLPAARQILQTLASGSPDSRLTQSATAALARLATSSKFLSR